MIAPADQPPKDSFSIETGSGKPVHVSVFGEVQYLPAQQMMADFASGRQADEVDQIWLLQHPAVYTLGTACRQSTLLPSSIDMVKSDRGGQITYHGPGQVVMYPLLNLKRLGLGVKALVALLEQAVIDLLADYDIAGHRRPDAPGVYVKHKKIAALGLRIRRGNCYHGLSLNVDMDLSPFSNIDPCGYQGLQVTQLADYVQNPDVEQIAHKLLGKFVELI